MGQETAVSWLLRLITRFTPLRLQADGKVLVGSEGFNFGLTRLNSNGSADTNFNANAYASIVSTEPFHGLRIFGIIVQPDGKVLVAGIENLLRLNANGTLDNSFTSGQSGFIYSMALQPDGKVIIGGYLYDPANNSSSYGLARLHANGSIDNTFDGAAGQNGIFNSIVVQPDGRVLVGGKFIGTNNTCVARLNGNGTMDATFVEVTGVGRGTWPEANAIRLQPDGKVIIGGQFVSIHGQSRTNLARLNGDGSLDSNFPNGTGGVNGQPQSYPGTSVKAIALQTNGTMFIGGAFTTVNGTHRSRVARLNADGSLDATFQPGRGLDYPVSRVVPSDGKVLIGGGLTFINGTNRYASARLNADGSLDSTFISDSFNPDLGSFYLGPYDYAATNVLAVQSDGKILVWWTLTQYQCDPLGENCEYYSSYLLARFNRDGSRDTNFASYIAINGSVNAVAIQTDGKLLVGGDFSTVHGTNRAGIARLNADGSLDNSFNPAAGISGVSSIALQPDGKVLIGVGSYVVSGTNRFGIARLNANGSLDSSFNPGTGALGVSSVALQANGKVLIGGDFTTVNGTNRNRIARLNANGSLDLSFNPGTGADGLVRSIALQADGNVLMGGDFTSVNGVVRPRVARLHGADVAPSLNISRSNEFMLVSWPLSAAGFVLDQSLTTTGVWSQVAFPYTTNANVISVSDSSSVGSRFYRLRKP